MDESNTGWDDEFLGDLPLEEPVNFTDWCEVSLGSEEEQDLRGRLRFRKDSRSSEEMPCVTTTNQTGISLDSTKYNQERFNEAKPQESLAYNLGMMVVQKAANVVNNVADGGKRNRDVIKQLRLDLENMTQGYEELQKEFENSKQWIAYYQKLKGVMENQVAEISERFTQQYKSVQENLLKSEAEVECCRREVHNAALVKENMDTELEDARRAIEDLTLQVEEASKQSLQSEASVCCASTQASMEKEAPKQTPSLNCKSTQKNMVSKDAWTDTTSLSSPPQQTNPTTMLRCKERQLCDATKALEIAHARGDKLRQQLVSSAEAMKSQTYQMKICRAALEVALNESYDLKVLLKEERKKQQDAQISLQEEMRQHQLTTTELIEQKSLLCKINADAAAKESKLLHHHKRMCVELTRNDRLLQESNLNRIVDGLVDNAISAAYRTRLKTLYFEREEALKNESHENSERLKLSEFTLLKLQKQVKLLEQQLKHKEEDLTQYKSQICALLKEADSQKVFEVETEKKEKDLQEVISASELKFSCLKTRLEKVLNEKSVKISEICFQIKTLKSENSKLKLNSNSKQDLKTFSTQTDLLGSDISKMQNGVCAVEINAPELLKRFQTSSEENLELRQDLIQMRSEMKQNQDHFAQTENMCLNLQRALDSERRSFYEKEYMLSQVEEECKRLSWTCRKQNAELLKLQQENAQLRKSSSDGQSQKLDSNTSSEPVSINFLTQKSEMVEHKPEILPAHVFEQGDANESRRSSLSRLDTIPESDEMSSISNDCKSTMLAKRAKNQTIESAENEREHVRSSDSNVDIVNAKQSFNTKRTEDNSYAADDQFNPSTKKQAPVAKKWVKETLKGVGEEVTPSFPIWRREQIMDSNPSVASEASTSCNSLHEFDAKQIKDANQALYSGLRHSLDAIAPRQIGIPMSDEAFQRLLNDSPTDCYTHIEHSHDDGYSTSSNSVLDEGSQQCLIWENVELNLPRKVEPLCDSSQVSNAECISLSKTDSDDDEDDRHYFVTYAGVKFDLAKFSMARMREITASCEATSTAEGVNAFFEFLAVQVEELNQDPYWCKHHNLGRPEDWLSLKNCYL